MSAPYPTAERACRTVRTPRLPRHGTPIDVGELPTGLLEAQSKLMAEATFLMIRTSLVVGVVPSVVGHPLRANATAELGAGHMVAVASCPLVNGASSMSTQLGHRAPSQAS